MPIDLLDIFDHRIDFDPSQDLEAQTKDVPGKWVVYLLAGANDEPIQLLCVKNLRASLRRRLGEGAEQMLEPTRKVDYRQIVRRVYWTRVDSAFEADVVYLEAARALFPDTYQGMVGFRPAWFVHVDPAAEFPRYVKTHDLRPRPGVLVGPVEDKHAAQRMIELAEDSFDLCRYYNVLVQAPHGSPCAYKEMGKCPAPCDGTVPMTHYRDSIARSAEALVDPKQQVATLKAQMTSAAAALEFERAGRVKALVDAIGQLGKGPFRHARRLEDFAYVSLQRGPWAQTAKVFLITLGRIDPVACLTREPANPTDLLRHVLELDQARRATSEVDQAGAERIGVVAHHLFVSKQQHGAFIPIADVTEKSLAKAWKDLQKQKVPEETDAEGVTKELNAL